MKVRILDPTGNITALVEGPVPPSEQPAAAAMLMERHPAVEQVGFVRFGPEAVSLRMAGGEYVLSDLRNPNPDSRSGSLTLSMEEFYAGAKDADYLIYNTNIDSSVSSLSDILAKNSLLGEFRAVKKGQVYLTDRYFYQATDILGEMIVDLHRMFAGENGTNMTFLRHLE